MKRPLAALALLVCCGCDPSVIYDTPGAPNALDASADHMPAANDAAAMDAAVALDGSTSRTVAEFQTEQADSFCAALEVACGKPAGWLPAKCRSTYLPGFANLFEDLTIPNVVTGGRVMVVPLKAEHCIEALRGIPLPVRTAAQHAAVVDACKDAIVGIQPIGSPCRGNIECAPDEACKNIADGSGTCAPIDGAGARCEYSSPRRVRSNTCSYHGIGDTGRFCSNTDNATGVCIARFSVGTECVFDTQCASDLCGPGVGGGFVCVATYDEFATNGSCQFFTQP